MRQGLRVDTRAVYWKFTDQEAGFKHAAALTAVRIPFTLTFYTLPGECDQQRANRLARELLDAKAKISKLEAAAKRKRKKTTKPKRR